MKTREFIMVGACGIVTITPATAAEFNGPYAGVNVGLVSGDIEAEYDLSPLSLGSVSGEEDLTGFEGGAFVGYRHAFDNGLVLGAEIGGLLGEADAEADGVFVTGDEFSIEKAREFYVSVKPGYVFSERVYGYLIGGYQQAVFDWEYAVGGSTASGDESFDGYHFGAGAEYMPMNDVSFRLEYKYQSYEDESFTTPGVGTETYEGDESVVRLGVAYNF